MTSEVLLVGPTGRLQLPADAFHWALCVAPKPPVENNVISSVCAGGRAAQPIRLDAGSATDAGASAPPLQIIDGQGPKVAVTIPSSACFQNGPETPPTMPGEPQLRPRDPDVSGGYYQPIVLDTTLSDGSLVESVGLERIRCNLPNASGDVILDFFNRYKPNQNPVLAILTAGGMAVSPTAAGMPAITIPRGTSIDMVASWTAESRETYPVYDLNTRTLVDHPEELTVSWFATAGEFTFDRTGRSETESENTVTNIWKAPEAAGSVTVWLVLGDSRGGSSFEEYLLSVQ